MTTDETEPLLSVENLHTQFNTHGGAVHAVNGVSFSVEEGEIVGVVGESGSGKSVTALSIMRLESPGRIVDGSIRYRGRELTEATDREIRQLRGGGIAMVFQDPMSTLNPVFTVSEQIAESLKVHESPDDQRLLDYLRVPLFSKRRDWQAKTQRAVELMEQVGIPHPEERIDAYPHEFSGGMRQRAMLAVALASEPDLLIADEPTTALDVTIQAQILRELRRLNEEFGMSILMVTHDLGVVADLCDRVVVMYGGEVMESGTTEQILTEPKHPYTKALLECMPQNTARKEPLNVIEGTVPDMVGGLSGCPFASRCGHTSDECTAGDVPVIEVGTGHTAKCGELDLHGDAEPEQTVVHAEGGDSNE